MRRDVEFEGAGGVVLRGSLHLPDEGEGPWPAVVMAHGFSATKEMGLEAFAERFASAGYVALAYDHRNLGASDGEPRQLINAWTQARDYRYAVGWAAGLPEVDAGRVAVWGSSYSAGQAIVVGACDERVRAVIGNVPFACLPGSDYDDPAVGARFAEICAALVDESGDGPADRTEGATDLAVVPEPGVDLPAFLDQPESARWFLEAGRRPGTRWENRVSVVGLGSVKPVFDPGVALLNLGSKPVLLVVATDDRLAPTADTLAVFERVSGPKRLELVVGDHFVPYSGAELDQASAAMIAFLDDHL